MSLKRYQIALLFFSLGIFSVVFLFTHLAGLNEVSEEEGGYISEYTTIQIFFSSIVEDPGTLNCDITYPVERAVRRLSNNDKSVLAEYAFLALDELLKGPAGYEKENGYFTSINDGVKIKTIIIEDGVATVDFDSKLDEGVAGSCTVQAIRSQITNTLKQFAEVQDVVITIDGESEEILQP